jgi:YVTN family beta-propeller protein
MKTLALNGRWTTLLMAVFLYASFLFGAPMITSLSPSFGPVSGGNSVTIRGSGFLGTTSVDFGPYSATSFTIVSDQRIDVTAPIGVATNVTVSVSSRNGTSPSTPAAIYTYQGDWIGDVTNLSSNSVTIFDIPSDAVMTTLGGELSDPRSIIFTPDGSRAYVTNATASTVEVIDTATRDFTTSISVGTSPFSLAINPAGTRVYVTNFSANTVSVIDTSTNSVIATIDVGTRPRGIVLTPDGSKAYVANSMGSSVSVINLSTNSVSKTITGFTTPFDIAVNPLGTFAYVTQNTSPGSFRVIDTTTDTITGPSHTLTGINARAIAIAPSGLTAYIANFSSVTNHLSVIDLVTNRETATISVGDNPADIAINSTDTTAYITDFTSNTVTVVDLTTHTVLTTMSVGLTPTGIALTSDETQAYVANSGHDSIGVIDLATNRIVATIHGPFNNPLGLAINPAGTLAYIATHSVNTPNGIAVIDIATNTVIDMITGSTDPADIAITPDGTKAYVTNQTTPGSVDVIDLTTNTITANIPVGDRPFGIAITPAGTKAYVANLGNDSVSIIDLATNRVVDTITGVKGANVITIAPDGTTAYVSGISSSSVFAIDLSTNMMMTISVGSGPEGIAISPDGATVFVANSWANTVSAIDVASNKVMTITVGSTPETISITPDGTRAYVTVIGLAEVVVLDLTDPTFPIIDIIPVGIAPYGVAITPDQAPVASFTFTGGISGEFTHFDASNSRSPVGTIVSYTWDFGDGTVATTTTDFHQPSLYRARLLCGHADSCQLSGNFHHPNFYWPDTDAQWQFQCHRHANHCYRSTSSNNYKHSFHFWTRERWNNCIYELTLSILNLAESHGINRDKMIAEEHWDRLLMAYSKSWD